MLEEQPAVHEIGGTGHGVLAERLAPERRIDPEPGALPVGRIGVEADAMIAAELAKERQELASSATDLQKVLVAEGVSLDQLIGQALLESPQDGGMSTRLLVDGRTIDRPGSNAALKTRPQTLQNESATSPRGTAIASSLLAGSNRLSAGTPRFHRTHRSRLQPQPGQLRVVTLPSSDASVASWVRYTAWAVSMG